MFGKILIVLHLGLSLTFATWALVLFTSRIDWTDKKGTGTQSDGELSVRMADYDRLAKSSARPADARFREARYRELLPEWWKPVTARDAETISGRVKEFWSAAAISG